ncbi:hypothetical protein QR680_001585 [Steinernema hermaphroditum]|uniref:Uncharacterized protein n=1 Tax=Steinernema hermaphroditum TaxID=289476 RepID=A0AA39GZQ1_9BILA|nr:hypothetical protein QR680_001585 [Steinernema hermaphroditum]
MRPLCTLLLLTFAVFVVAHRTENAVPIVQHSEDENDNKNLSAVEKVSLRMDQENAKCLKKRSNPVAEKNIAEGASKDMHIDNIQKAKDGVAYEIHVDDGKPTRQETPRRPKRAQSNSDADKQGIRISNENKTPGGLSYSVDFNGGDKDKPHENARSAALKDRAKRTVFSEGIVREPSERLSSMERHSGDKFRLSRLRFEEPSDEEAFFGTTDTTESWMDKKVEVAAPKNTPHAFQSNEVLLSEINKIQPLDSAFAQNADGKGRNSEDGAAMFGSIRQDESAVRPFNTFRPLVQITESSSSEEGSQSDSDSAQNDPWIRRPSPLDSRSPAIGNLVEDESDQGSPEAASNFENENSIKSDESSEEKIVVVVVNSQPEIRLPLPPPPFRSSESREFGAPPTGWNPHRWHHRRPQFHRFHHFGPDSSSSESNEKGNQQNKMAPGAHYETNYITNNIGVLPNQEAPFHEGFRRHPIFGSVMQVDAPPTEKEEDPTLRKHIADNRFGGTEEAPGMLLVVSEETDSTDPESFSFNLTVGPMTLVVIFLALLLFFFVHVIRRMLVPAHNACAPPTVSVIPMKS